MTSYRFTILVRQDVSLYYFRTNTTIYIIGIVQILYQGSFIKVDQYFCKLSERSEDFYTFFFFNLQGLSFLIACYMLYPGSKLRTKGNHQTQQKEKYHFSNKKGPFSLLQVFLNKKTAFSLHFKMGSSKNRHAFCLNKPFSCYIVVKMLLTPGVFFFHNLNL